MVVGPKVGCDEGCDVGWVGLQEGCIDGPLVGNENGCDEGRVDGIIEGRLLGWYVGSTVG